METERSPQAVPAYAAFISYNHRDEAAAGWIHRALETFRVPSEVTIPGNLPTRDRRLSPIFRDREELSSSSDLSQSIQAAIASANALIVICSPAAAASRWVGEEIRQFRRVHGDGRVFALIAEGDENGNPVFPDALLRELNPDGTFGSAVGEPLAADIRSGKDGRALAKLKIAAGLLGVGLDDLRRRDEARARRNLTYVATGSLAGMALASGLAIWAVLSEQEADRQRIRAEAEAMTATRTAEFMVDLFELAGPDKARGRDVTAKEILDKGVARIEEGLDAEPVIQSNLMHTMGRVYTGLGLYGDAAGLLTKARDRRVEAGADPIDIFTTENALGLALHEKGDFDKAGEIFEKLAGEAQTRIVAGDWNDVYADAFSGLGEVEMRRDALESARRRFQSAIANLEVAGAASTEEYAKAVLGLGRAQVMLEEYDEAVITLDRADDLYVEIKGENHYIRTQILNDLASLIYWRGDPARAEELFAESLVVTRYHLGDEHPETVTNQNNLGRMQLEIGEIEKAYESLSNAVQTQRDNERTGHIDFAFLLNSLALIESERGRHVEAIADFAEALALVKGKNHRLEGPILINAGRASCAAGEGDEGLAQISTGRRLLAGHYEAGDWRYGVAEEFEAVCLAAAGDRVAALDRAAAGYELLKKARGEDHYFTVRAGRLVRSLP